MSISQQIAKRESIIDRDFQEALRVLNRAAYRATRLSSMKATDHGALMTIARMTDDLVDNYPDKRSANHPDYEVAAE